MLVLTVPANNWDSLAYHLTRAAFWTQQHGLDWIANAPTGRMNEFQPLAEQEVFFLFAATGTGVLFAVPQYLARARDPRGRLRRLAPPRLRRARLGRECLPALDLRAVTLEATTAQNDLVAASTVAVAACLLLGTAKHEAALAGVALGLGLGVKLTTVLVWPVLAVLAWTRGRARRHSRCCGRRGRLRPRRARRLRPQPRAHRATCSATAAAVPRTRPRRPSPAACTPCCTSSTGSSTSRRSRTG